MREGRTANACGFHLVNTRGLRQSNAAPVHSPPTPLTITPDQYEKLGQFYFGRTYDLDAKQPKDELVLYDSKDLVTHGVVLGMTGSGKTGLCLALIEEALMDGIPIIAIDPKGDIGNLLFTFPDLSGEKLKPWVNPDDARRKGVSVDDYANAQAETWKKGLGDWGQSVDRIKTLREQCGHDHLHTRQQCWATRVHLEFAGGPRR